MPNHIRNNIKLNGKQDEIDKILLNVHIDEYGVGSIDFEKIIPIPIEIKNDTSKYRDWIIKNWGTKWNSYGYSDIKNNQENTLKFNTANSSPVPIIKMLSSLHPNIEFVHSWADDDYGKNCCIMTFKGGETIDTYYPKTQKEGIELATKVWECEPEDIGYHINATETEYISTREEDYELIELLDKTALYADERLTLSDIPQGFNLYFIRRSDDDERFATLENFVAVNHGGSILVDEPFDFGEKEYIEFTDETRPNFLNQTISIEDYINKNYSEDVVETEELTGGIML